MFIGHYAVAFASKRIAPSVSLGTLFLATQLIDLLFPLFLLLGLEHVRIDPGNTAVTPLDFHDYPFSHSLLAVIIWSAILAGTYYGIKRSRRDALVLGAVVIMHWVLDLISHRPDLQLVPGFGTRVGLGLWHFRSATFIVESALFAAGVIIYARSTKALDRTGAYAFWSLVFVLSVLYIGNLLGPPPPDMQGLAIVSLAQGLFIIWGYWIDKHRTTVLR